MPASDDRTDPSPEASSHPGRLGWLGLVAGALAIAAMIVVGLGATAGWVLGQGDDRDGGHDGSLTTDAQATTSLGASEDAAGYSVWDRNDDGSPVRWDPCSPVELVIADDLAPDGWRDDLEVAVSILEDATGLDLRIVDDVDERPVADRSPYQPARYGDRWAPVLVAWSTPGQDGLPLRDVDRGLAIPVAVGSDGDRTYVSGQVVLNADRDDLEVGQEDRAGSWGATVLHELIHVIGLGHADDPDELMARFPGEGTVELGPGDLAGLRAVGAAGDCRDVPEPRPIDVELPREADR